MPELHSVIEGKVTEARMDVVTSRPGGSTRWLIDVRTVDGQNERGKAHGVDKVIADAEQEKRARYDGAAVPFAIELRGRLGGAAAELLETLAGEASLVSGARTATLVRQWRRSLDIVIAFETGEAVRTAACGLEAVPLEACCAAFWAPRRGTRSRQQQISATDLSGACVVSEAAAF